MSTSPIVKSILEICAMTDCQKPGQKQCQACRSASYCSAEHQKEDWKRHRRNCPQFVLRVNSELNRHFVATRKIRVGSIILDENPLIYGPRVPVPSTASSSSIVDTEIDQRYCLSCCKSIVESSTICPKCTWPLFCSLKCAKVRAHAGSECKYFTKKKIKYRQSILPSHVFYRGIMILRAILQKPNLGDQLDCTTWASLYKLQHERSDNSLTGGYTVEPWMVTMLESCFKMKDLNYDATDWTRINGAINVNAFSIERAEEEGERPSEVTALFFKSSFFAHSCVPNCIWGLGYSPEFPMRIRASRTIEKDEVLTLSYNSNWGSYGTVKRREIILDTGGFLCKCTRCVDPTELGTFMSSLKCSIASCAGYLVPALQTNGEEWRWECSFGGSSCPIANFGAGINSAIKTKPIEQELNGILSTLNFLSLTTAGDFVMKFISAYSGTPLHPNHWILQHASQTLVHVFGSQIKKLTPAQLDNFVNQCRHLLKMTKILNPGISLQSAVLELYLSRALFLQYKTMDYLVLNDDQTRPKLEMLQEIRDLQLDSLLYWKNDIQSKRQDQAMGYEAFQLNHEILTVFAEYEELNNL